MRSIGDLRKGKIVSETGSQKPKLSRRASLINMVWMFLRVGLETVAQIATARQQEALAATARALESAGQSIVKWFAADRL